MNTSEEKKIITDMNELRQELSNTPRIRLKFAKAMTILLAEHNIKISGDLLGKLTLTTCDELEEKGIGSDQMLVTTWTN